MGSLMWQFDPRAYPLAYALSAICVPTLSWGRLLCSAFTKLIFCIHPRRTTITNEKVSPAGVQDSEAAAAVSYE